MFDNKRKLSIVASKGGGGRKKVESSFMGVTSFGPPSGSLSVSAIGGYYNHVDTILYGIIAEDEAYLRRYYRDIYNYDSIAGSCVDLMSTLPFSDWSLTGATEEQIEVFERNTEKLNLKTLFPEMSIDYLVNGKFCASMLYDRDVNSFSDLMPHDVDYLEISNSPLYGTDPVLKLRIGKELREFLHSNNPYFSQLRERIPANMVSAMRHGKVTLEPLTTLFIPRKTYVESTGTSLYRRIIPIYLLEKILYRGTITEATRRQRSTMHLQVGSEYWEPQDEDLQMLVSLFQQADLDPMGAILATRNDVQTNDIRPAGDFWKWTDINDVANSIKMRALGISDAFLSGEASYNTMEVSFTVFIEYLRAYREMMTRKVFYDKMFPIISVLHNFRKDDDKGKRTSQEVQGRQRLTAMVNREIRELADSVSVDNKDLDLQHMSQSSNLVIPEVKWHKQLRPQADREYLDVLNTLAERGVPITIRAWAAAGGLNMDSLVEDLEQDVKTRNEIKKILDQLNTNGMGGDDDSEGLFSSFKQENVAAAIRRLSPNSVERIPLLEREFSEHDREVKAYSPTGKPHWLPNQHKQHRRVNEKLDKSLRNLSDPHVYETRRRQGKNRS